MSPPGILRYSCCASGCGNKYYNPLYNETHIHKKFFKFPDKHPQRRRQWFEIMNLPETDKRRYSCEDHFEDSAIRKCKTKLIKFALPSNRCSKDNTETPETPVMDNVFEHSKISSEPIVVQEDTESANVRYSSILAQIGESRLKNLSPKKKKMYYINKTQCRTINRHRKSL